jgi:hypothetical protein
VVPDHGVAGKAAHAPAAPRVRRRLAAGTRRVPTLGVLNQTKPNNKNIEEIPGAGVSVPEFSRPAKLHSLGGPVRP